jgi:cytochrome c biogenesis protein CcdA/thiol-disulfide isomerase/thioredoxin
VLVLLVVGFLGGAITGISPCIVPVLPVVVAGGATGGSRWTPFSIVAGLIASFSLFTLVGGSILSVLHLPEDFLRDLGIAALLLLAAGLLVPRLGALLERPFARLGARRTAGSGSGFVLGVSLGLVFVPCAGPVLAAISVVAATHRVGLASVLLTVAYAAGAALPLLVFSLVARRTAQGWKRLRGRAPAIRRAAGAVLAVTALAIAFDVTRPLQTSVPGYTSALENRIEGTDGVAHRLQALTREHGGYSATSASGSSLPDLGAAPEFRGITAWLNTPGDHSLSLRSLRGKVVLVDFWTYSCINCQRTLPHVEAWYRQYASEGLVVVGVHTPEFDFEHVVSNVRSAAAQLGVQYPIAVDDRDATWDAYSNQYWPAEYLIDQSGHVRHVHFGEGDYGGTESAIRSLLHAGGSRMLPGATMVTNVTPMEPTTPETYIGYARLQDYVGGPIQPDTTASYTAPSQVPLNGWALRGVWTVGAERATAGSGAGLELEFSAQDVYLVLAGTGTVEVSLDGNIVSTIQVSGVPGLYTLFSSGRSTTGLLQLKCSAGISAYDFTFG